MVNVADEIEGSPISRIAKQLGVEVPAHMPSRRDTPAAVPRQKPAEVATPSHTAPAIDSQALKATTAIPPKTDPRIRQPPPSAPPAPLTIDELFAAGAGGPISADDLSDDDVDTLDSLRTSMEKGALVLRSLAELCVEKGVFTREEMKRRNQQTKS